MQRGTRPSRLRSSQAAAGVRRRVRAGLVAGGAVTGLAAALLAAPAAGSSAAVAGPGGSPAARSGADRLPLGAAELPESRRATRLAEGVTWTRIRRGDKESEPGAIAATRYGPWVVNVVTIDPRKATGRLRITWGADMARTETTSALARMTGALVAVNGGFFSIGSADSPGDPVGLSVFDGMLASEPQRGASIGMTIDSRSKRVAVSNFTWVGTVRNRTTKASARLNGINRAPRVPADCEEGCSAPGELVMVNRLFSATTPRGPGSEVVVDAKGCVTETRTPRGGSLPRWHTAYQATGASVERLAAVVPGGCLQHLERLTFATGRNVPLKSGFYAVNGRVILVRSGRIVATGSGAGFAGRHPRTIAGRTAGGSVVLVTIDGRRGSSVGATITESARVAKALGLVDAVNIDGGGSTTMAIRGQVVNRVSGNRERPVGDAIIYVP